MASTPLLGLSLPADGTTNWGTLVNTSITALLDSAVAGTTTLTVDADAILSDTTEATNQARQAIILWKPLSGTATRTITAPAKSKTYVVINATGGTQSIVFRGDTPTTGVTIPAGKAFMLAWNGADFVTTGVTTVNLATDVTGILAGVNGGTGVNNTGKTITLGGNLTTSGAFDTTLTTSAATNVTLPTTGTLATLAGNEALTNKTISGSSNTLSNIANASLTNSSITINGNAVSLGGSTTVTATATNALTIGTGLAGGSYNGSAAVTIDLAAGYGDTLNPYASKTANFVLAAPSGSAGVPTFRAIVAADIPTLDQNTTGTAAGLSATLVVASGGTGQTTYTNGELLIGNSTGNTLAKGTLTAGTGISVTNGAGSISIANTAPDQVVALTGAGATTTSGTYPNFTISSVNTTYGPATVSADGLIKLGDAAVQTTAANAVTTTAARTYSVQLNSSGQAVVNVPWSAGSATNPGGSDTQVQYNNAGAFGGSANFIFNGTQVGILNATPAATLDVGGSAIIGSTSAASGITIFRRATIPTSNATFSSLNFASTTDGTTLQAGAAILARASEDWSGAGSGTRLIFRTATNGVVGPSDKMTLENNGDLAVTGAITSNSVAVVTTTGTQTLSNKTLDSTCTINAPVANLAAGTAGQIPYQTGAGTTAFIAAGTAGYVLQSLGSSSAPVWVLKTSLPTANTIVNRDGSGGFAVNQLEITTGYGITWDSGGASDPFQKYALKTILGTSISVMEFSSPGTQYLYLSAGPAGPAGVWLKPSTAGSGQIGTIGLYDLNLYRNEVLYQTLDANGTVLASGKNLGLGGTSPSNSGTGITFPATQSASSDVNTLDDYEEGTFVPAVTGSVTAGTVSYGVQQGYYTKVGRLVTFSLYLGWFNGFGGAGDLRVSLPFTCNNGVFFIAGTTDFGASSPTTQYPVSQGGIAATNAYMTISTTSGINTQMAGQAWAAFGGVKMTGFYYT